MNMLNEYIAVRPKTQSGGLELADDLNPSGEVVYSATFTHIGGGQTKIIDTDLVGKLVLYEQGKYQKHQDLVLVPYKKLIAIL